MILRGLCVAAALAMALGWPEGATAGEAVYLIRHAEKAEGSDPPLTADGRARALRWADMLSETGIAAVITTTAARTRETGGIIARALGWETVEVGLNDTAGVIDLIGFDYADTSVLVVGHTETLPTLLRALGTGEAPTIEDEDFARLFITVPGEGLVAALRMPGH